MRRRIKEGMAREQRNARGQLRLAFADTQMLEASKMWTYTVLVTDVDYPLEAVAPLYRDRADCPPISMSGFDELKSQWSLGGFTTQDLARCQTTARAGALVYNWWSWYCRATHPGARLEAVTSRLLLLAAVGKAASHGGQTRLYLTPLHAKFETIKTLIANIRTVLQHVTATAEQMPTVDRWATLVCYICKRTVSGFATNPALKALGASG